MLLLNGLGLLLLNTCILHCHPFVLNATIVVIKLVANIAYPSKSAVYPQYATFVLRGRALRVARCGVAGTVIDYSLSRVSLPLAAGECAALYNDLAADDSLFDAVGDYQFEVYRLMRDKLG